ncbi:unnamed protein product [Rotaria magnacalcarata]
MDEEKDQDGYDGWKIVKPDVILFETSIGSLDKPIPHPILDDPSKMMRIIANPVYDKLTFSRAVNMRKITSTHQQSPQLNRPKQKILSMRSKSTDASHTDTTALPSPSESNTSQVESNISFIRRGAAAAAAPPPPFRLPTPPSAKLIEPQILSSTTSRSRAKTPRTNTQTLQSALTDNNKNVKKPIADGTVRYVNSRHGFEVQRYSSSNWLAVDIYTKDACQSHEKTFREMLDKKRQYERLSRSIYSSEYYTQRWNELLKSYKQGYLTHAEWAQQNYQLFCLKTLYSQAVKREQTHIKAFIEDSRRDRAKSAFKEWKGTKSDDNPQHQSRLTTARNQRTKEAASSSFLSNTSFSSPSSKTGDQNHTTSSDRSHRLSMSTNTECELQRIPNNQSKNSSQNTSNMLSSSSSSSSSSSTTSYVFDEQRWSLQAMLKRVVGLAEPLTKLPTVTKRKHSPVTNASNDSGFESIS